jgi:hypothetical protein
MKMDNQFYGSAGSLLESSFDIFYVEVQNFLSYLSKFTGLQNSENEFMHCQSNFIILLEGIIKLEKDHVSI